MQLKFSLTSTSDLDICLILSDTIASDQTLKPRPVPARIPESSRLDKRLCGIDFWHRFASQFSR